MVNLKVGLSGSLLEITTVAVEKAALIGVKSMEKEADDSGARLPVGLDLIAKSRLPSPSMITLVIRKVAFPELTIWNNDVLDSRTMVSGNKVPFAVAGRALFGAMSLSGDVLDEVPRTMMVGSVVLITLAET